MIIGRKPEIAILKELLGSDKAELLALYGRRRVGKTFLIQEYYKSHLAFQCGGQYQGKTPGQLLHFARQLDKYFPKREKQPVPNDWDEAFLQLQEALDQLATTGKKVVFIDEMPWLDTHKSGFLSAFSYFWNNYATARKDIIVVVCGSAASWILDKVLGDKGGLHNRVTRTIRLMPFTVAETDAYLRQRSIRLEPYNLLQLYMTIGGIPHYLNFVQKGKSLPQNINTMCFTKDGALVREFDNLYAALFNSADRHVRIIRALSTKTIGLTRTALLKLAKLDSGGGSSDILKELEESGFIMKVRPFANQEKNTLYRLTDEFSLFYLRFMEHVSTEGSNYWMSIINTPLYNTWGGYAFESLCIKESQAIKEALQIAGISSNVYSWNGTHDGKGAQIDMLIDRADGVINICEMKFSIDSYTITKAYAEKLKQKISIFRSATGTNKNCWVTFITTYGVEKNTYFENLVESELSMEIFFDK
jgi:AAA+ ATPase superfamily predicted ATPase